MKQNFKRRRSRSYIFLPISLIGECAFVFLLIFFSKLAQTALLINVFLAASVFIAILSVDIDDVYKTLALIYLVLFPVISTVSLFALLLSVKRRVREPEGLFRTAFYDCEYFPFGEEFFADLLDRANKAKERIYLEFYIVKNGRIWESVKNVLVKKAAEGVDVKLSIDGFGGYQLHKKLKKWLISHKIGCVYYNPPGYMPNLFFGCRSHRKLAVIDGSAYVGGINVGDEYANATRPYGVWKDCAVRLDGDISDLFATCILLSHGKTVRFPTATAGSVANAYFDRPFGSSSLKKLCIAAMLTNRVTEIATPYFVPDRAFFEALKFALANGHTVRIFLPGIPDKRFVYSVSLAYAREAKECGAEIFIYKPGFLHAKICLSGKSAVIGSGNIDYRSFFLQRECGVITEDERLVGLVKNDVNEIKKRSESAVFPPLNRKSPLYRLKLALIKLISPLI